MRRCPVPHHRVDDEGTEIADEALNAWSGALWSGRVSVPLGQSATASLQAVIWDYSSITGARLATELTA